MVFIRRFLLVFIGLLFVLPTRGLEEIDGTPVSGHIAYIGEDHNVYTFDMASEVTFAMTEDASPARRYQWPTWGIDGRLAYFCCDLEFAQQFDTAAYIASDSQTIGDIVFEGLAESIIYAAWAPANCENSANCLDLAMLVNDYRNGGLYVELVHDTTDSRITQTIAEAAPFYYSWSADGTQILFHLNNTDLSIYNPASNDFDENFDYRSSGTFQAPAWSPTDSRVAAVIPADQSGQSDLVVIDEGEIVQLVRNIQGNVSFSWSPDGHYIAYRIVDENGLNSLNIINARTGEVVGKSTLPGVVAFFWSPDSQKIAFVTPETPPGSIQSPEQTERVNYAQAQPIQDLVSLTWHIFDIETQISQTLNSFVPTANFIYLLLYFDQFAQSHRVWSPDSQYLVYTELMLADSPTSLVQIRNVLDATAVPVTIDNGTFAVWSYDE